MKSAFLLHNAVVAVAYPAAFAAESAGLLPSSFVSLPVLAGYYVGAGVVAFACDDFRRGSRRAAPPKRRNARTPATVETATAAAESGCDAMPAWATRTYSS